MISCKEIFSKFKLLSFALLATMVLTGCTGQQGERGPRGEDGADGKTPTIAINEDGYWVINGDVTEYKAVANDGKDGVAGEDGEIPSIDINEAGYWVINGKVTEVKATGTDGKTGKDGKTPTITINEAGYWIINGKVTDIKATGTDGKDGEDGTTPIITINEAGYWVINGVVTEFKAVGKDGEIVYIEPEIKYTIGQTVKFNPGDGEKTWNVIGEDKTTVTLMLTENLGNTVPWYRTGANNNYGPKDALEYLNSLTTNWYNVAPIKTFSYVNNQNGTALQNGYHKLEIEDGNTRLTDKSGTVVTEVAGISKARILSREEVFEIAQKTNTNLTEENLRTYILDNIGLVNTFLQSQGMQVELKTVDEVISFAIQLQGFEWLKNESKYMQTYNVVYALIYELGITPPHDILLPSYMYQNLNSDHAPFAYWTLSARANESGDAWYVRYSGHVYDNSVNNIINYGVRPVITISKSLPVETIN